MNSQRPSEMGDNQGVQKAPSKKSRQGGNERKRLKVLPSIEGGDLNLPEDLNALPAKTVLNLKKEFLKDQDLEELAMKQQINSHKLTFNDQDIVDEIDYQSSDDDVAVNIKNETNEIQQNEYIERKLKILKADRLRNDHNAFLRVTVMNNHERILKYQDTYPLLNFRVSIYLFIDDFRKICYHIVKHPFFEFVSIMIILTNSLFMMMDDPTTISGDSLADTSDTLFMYLYSVEIILKVMGQGIIGGRTAFLKDVWNIFDLFIVLSSWLNYLLANIQINLSALRSFRVLRPLRTVSAIRPLRALIKTIFSSIPDLIEIILIMIFIYFIFAIAGVNLFSGIFVKRCIDPFTAEMYNPETICSDDASCPGIFTCAGGFAAKNWGITNFDNVGSSMLMTFQVTTTEGWFEMRITSFNSFSGVFKIIVVLYFLALIFVGTFFFMNLMLAVIINKFTEANEAKNQKIVEFVHNPNCICHSSVSLRYIKKKNAFPELVCKNMVSNLKRKFYHERVLNAEIEFTNDYEFKIVDFYADKNFRKLQATGSSSNVDGLGSQTLSDLNKGELIEVNYNNGNENPFLWENKKKNVKVPGERVIKKVQSSDLEEHKPLIKGRLSLQENATIAQADLERFQRIIENQKLLVRQMSDQSSQLVVSDDFDSSQHKKQNENKAPQNLFELERDLIEALFQNKKNKNNEADPQIEMSQYNKTFSESVAGKTNGGTGTGTIGGTMLGTRNGTKSMKSGGTEKNQKQDERIKALASIGIKFLKIDQDACHDYQIPEAMSSKFDVMPSLLLEAEKDKTKNLKEKEKMKIVYDVKKTLADIYTYQMNYYKLARRESKTESQNNLDESESFKTTQLDNITVRSMTKQDAIMLDHLKVATTNYYPLYDPPAHIVLKQAPKVVPESEEKDQVMTSSKKNLQNKATKGVLRNFYTAKSFFEEQFAYVNELKQTNNRGDEQLMKITPKEEISHFRERILERDEQAGMISTHNWSGTEIIFPGTFSSHKIESILNALNFQSLEMWLPGFWGGVTMIRARIRNHFNDWLSNFFMCLVLLNILMLALDGLIDSSISNFFVQINNVLTGLFTLELILKVFAYGLRTFSNDIFNIFDVAIVSISIVELVMNSESGVLSVIRVIRVFRAVRVLRMARLLRSLRFMRVIIEVIMKSSEQFMYTALLMLIFLLIFTLVGMNLFGGTFNFYADGEIKKQNFDSFFMAFTSVFQIMTVENWNDILYLCLRSNQNNIIVYSFLISWIFIGNYVFLNLILAILIDGFTTSENSLNDIEDEETEIRRIIQEKKSKEIERLKQMREKKELIDKYEDGDSEEDPEKESEMSSSKKESFIFQEGRSELSANFDHSSTNNELSDKPDFAENSISMSSVDDINLYIKENKIIQKEEDIWKNIFCDCALFFFTKENPVRKFIAKIVVHPNFDSTILGIICLSSIKLAIDTYLTDTTTMIYQIFQVLDDVFTVAFLLECMVKILTYGFVFCPTSYLRDSWSILDFFIVICSMIDMLVSSVNLPFVKVLRLLRTLRPLRFLSHYENLRIVVVALIESMSGIANVAIVILLFWLMFGILGINLLGNKMGYCNVTPYYHINKETCLAQGNQWLNYGFNFDNIIVSMQSLFVLTSQENWPGYMFLSMDGDYPESGPSPLNSPYIAYFFFVFIIIGSMFLSNLFTSVIFFHFSMVHHKETNKRFTLMTDDQMKWIHMQQLIAIADPNYELVTPPTNKVQLFLYNIVNHIVFEASIMLIIILNMISMATVYDGMSSRHSSVLNTINLIFTGIFVFEMVMKMAACGFKKYFLDSWNQFDFIIVFTSLMDIVLSNAVNMSSIRIYPQLIRVLRIIRITRLFKIMRNKRLKGFDKILKTLIYGFPALFNVILLLMLMYSIFAVMGVFIFQGDVDYFSDFGTALIYLFRFSTGEDWPNNMYALGAKRGVIADIYFISFAFISSFVMLNMFGMVVVQQFEKFYMNSDNPLNSFEEVAYDFRKTWSHFTAKQKGTKIKYTDVYNFFVCLKSPLGFHVPDKSNYLNLRETINLKQCLDSLRFNPNYIRKRIAAMNLFIDSEGFITFGQMLHAAMKNAYGIKCMHEAEKKVSKEIRKIELETIGKVLRRQKPEPKSVVKEVRYSNKTANPFRNLLFLQLVYHSWYNYTLKLSKKKNKLVEDEMEKESGSEFEDNVLAYIKKPATLAFNASVRSYD